MELDSLSVSGSLVGEGSNTNIKIKTTGGISVGSSGKIGGTAVNKENNMVSLISTGGPISIAGKVEGKKGANVQANGPVSISGSVKSSHNWVQVESKTGPVNISGSGVVEGTGVVRIQAGAKQPVNINCRVESKRSNVVINPGRRRTAGNVTVGKGDSLIAAREVIINADTLFISGLIKARTIQKHVKVTIMDSSGSIEGKVRTRNKIDTLYAAKERQETKPAEHGGSCSIVGEGNCTINLTNAPGALNFTGPVLVATGPGGKIDLRGNPAGIPVIISPAEIQLFADKIELDPGVLLESICGPGPVLSGPAVPILRVADACVWSDCGYPGMKLEVQFKVQNMGNVPDTFVLNAHDALGWPLSLSDNELVLDNFNVYDSTVTVFVDVPSGAIPGIDTNYIYLSATSRTDPTMSYEEETYVAVHDSSELVDVQITPWWVYGGNPGDTLRVDYWIMNTGELDMLFKLDITDSLGWDIVPTSWWNDTLHITSDYDTFIAVFLKIPPDANIGDRNRLYMKATAIVFPQVWKLDTLTYVVGDEILSAGEEDVPRYRRIEHSAYPNPFNPSVVIRFTTPGGPTTIDIYDIRGRHIRRAFTGRLENGEYRRTWDGLDEKGRKVSSGVYFYRIKSGRHTARGKLVLLR